MGQVDFEKKIHPCNCIYIPTKYFLKYLQILLLLWNQMKFHVNRVKADSW